MRILMVLDEDFPPDVRVENEIKVLLNEGHQLDLLCYTRKNQVRKDNFGKANIIRIPISRYMYKLKAVALTFPFYFRFWEHNIRKTLANNKYDVLHIHDLPLLKTGLKIANESGLPLIADFHENRPEIMKMYHHVNTFPGNMLISINKWQDYQRQYTQAANKLILVTPEAKEYYSREYNIPAERIFVVPNYANPEQLNKIRADKLIIERYKDKFVIVYLGNTGIRRGTRTIIEAAKLLRNMEQYHFIIIGESREQAYLQQLVVENNLTNVELTGYIPFEKAVSYIMVSKIGLCPFLRNLHHDTTYSNKMFQYMAYGKAVIVSDCTAQANIVRKEECGLIFEAGNAADLAKQILKLNDKQLLDKYGKYGLDAVNRKYNTKVGHQELIRLYQSLNNNHFIKKHQPDAIQ